MAETFCAYEFGMVTLRLNRIIPVPMKTVHKLVTEIEIRYKDDANNRMPVFHLYLDSDPGLEVGGLIRLLNFYAFRISEKSLFLQRDQDNTGRFKNIVLYEVEIDREEYQDYRELAKNLAYFGFTTDMKIEHYG